MTINDFVYAKEDHAAAWTGNYVFNQLIPYIGNKRKLLDLIQAAIVHTGIGRGGIFLDVFAGSGVVSRMAKKLGYRVIANDWEPYAREINTCYIERNAAPRFSKLGGYEAAIERLNTLAPRVDWITKHLCPSDDNHYDPNRDRLFYTRSNGMLIDAIRHQIDEWEQAELIDRMERACLLAPLLYQACYTSNTSGVFKGFHNGWGGQTGTALYRILSRVRLKPAVFFDNAEENLVYGLDCLELASQLQKERILVDIAYLDPPYNQHPYGSNYHVLNTIALWDKPPLSEKIEGKNKAGIRLDWRTQRRSAYNYKGEAEQAYQQLLTTLNAKFILTSYSTDGMIPLQNLVDACTRRGHTEYLLRTYKRYRVSTQRFSYKPVNIEFVLIVNTERQHSGPGVAEICEHIRNQEQLALSNHRESQSLFPSRYGQNGLSYK